MIKRLRALAALMVLAAGMAAAVGACPGLAQAPDAPASKYVTYNRYTNVDGVHIFYREAGPADGPVVLLLQGFPTSSHMFRNLIPILSDRYHVIAPDYPGFGLSAAPDHTKFAYTFAHYATIVDDMLVQMGAKRYAIYLFDYGAPVGFRVAIKHPERVTALIVQNGNAYAQGLQKFWDPMKVYWKSNTPAHRAALDFLVTLKTTQFQYLHGMSDASRIDPDNWVHDMVYLNRPGNRDIQLDLFHDYGSNVPIYPKFQAFFRAYKPPTLIIWGKNDFIFPPAGAYPYKRDLPDAEFHLIDSGHFLLEDRSDLAFPMIRDFLDRKVAGTLSDR
jgi:pimeloyl-ACP methyl ester carboxylesterase